MSYSAEWIAVPAFISLLLLLIVPSFALIALAVVALVALLALVALAGALLATPYLLVRTLRRRLEARHAAPAVSLRPVEG
jgi:positive regulator of sigma E activity